MQRPGGGAALSCKPAVPGQQLVVFVGERIYVEIYGRLSAFL